MSEINKIENQIFDEERALYGLCETNIVNCRIDGPKDGESAFKECNNIIVENNFLNLRYPFWHNTNTKIINCEMTENCRAALWYDKNILIDNCKMNGIKALRECSEITVKNTIASSPEFIWKCNNVNIENVEILSSEYPFFECNNVKINALKMKGKYSFQYVQNMEIRNSELDTKDAFWHTKNVTVYDSIVKGEYLGWYSENLTLINCRIIGTQPFCYCKNLTLENCTMENCDLCFERCSNLNVEVHSKIESVKNPLDGKIVADEIGELIIEEEICDIKKTEIICKQKVRSLFH